MSLSTDSHPSGGDLRSLIGRRVTLTISDPWDFGEVHGNGPFPASIVDVTPDRDAKGGSGLLVRLVKPLWFQGNVCEYMIATPRTAGDDFARITRSEGLTCGFVSISPRGAKSTTPFGLTWWRGWGTLLGVVHMAEAGESVRR